MRSPTWRKCRWARCHSGLTSNGHNLVWPAPRMARPIPIGTTHLCSANGTVQFARTGPTNL
eukprot:12757334-Prorocentrum_lima.AAC.1